MKNLIRSAVVIAGCLSSTLAFADAHGAAPVQPVVAHAAEPVPGYAYRGDPGYWREGRADAWRNFEEAARIRRDQENARLANERAAFASRWGWNGSRMHRFDAHQAAERQSFERSEAARRAQFERQLDARGRWG